MRRSVAGHRHKGQCGQCSGCPERQNDPAHPAAGAGRGQHSGARPGSGGLVRRNVRGDVRGRRGPPGVVPRGGRGQVQGRVLLEHRQLKFAQLRARFDGQLLDQQRPSLLVRLECARLAAAPVEGDHQLPAEPFAHRVLGDKLLEFGAYDGVPAKRKFDVDPVLNSLNPKRLESACLQPGERPGLQISQRQAAPERVGFPQQSCGPPRIAVRKRLPPGRYLLLEQVHVQFAVRDMEQVTRRPGLQPRLPAAGDVAERLAQPGDLNAQYPVCRCRGLVAEQLIDQLVAGDDPVGVA